MLATKIHVASYMNMHSLKCVCKGDTALSHVLIRRQNSCSKQNYQSPFFMKPKGTVSNRSAVSPLDSYAGGWDKAKLRDQRVNEKLMPLLV